MAVRGRNLGAAEFRRVVIERHRPLPAGAREHRIGILRRLLRPRDELGAAREIARIDAELKIDAERRGDLVAIELTEALGRDAADDLADEKAERSDVIGGLRARRPDRRLRRQRLGHRLPIIDRARPKIVGQERQAAAMIEHPADEQRFFAVRGEFRPVARNRRVEIDLAAIDQHMQAGRGHCLADRHGVADRVLFPGLRLRDVAKSAPEIDDHAAVDGEREARPALFAAREIIGESVPHGGEFRIEPAAQRIAPAVAFDRARFLLHHTLLVMPPSTSMIAPSR